MTRLTSKEGTASETPCWYNRGLQELGSMCRGVCQEGLQHQSPGRGTQLQQDLHDRPPLLQESSQSTTAGPQSAPDCHVRLDALLQ
jgi:hypothetical protein